MSTQALFKIYTVKHLADWHGEQAMADRPTIIAKGTKDQILALLIENQDT
jgi:hypothetical protein